MRAETPEIQREDAGRLLAPMIHVERSVARQTTLVTLELPDEEIRRCDSAREVKSLVRSLLLRFGEEFAAAWVRWHEEQR